MWQVYYLRALNEVERQRWVTALALAKAKAIKNLESGIPMYMYTYVNICDVVSFSVIPI